MEIKRPDMSKATPVFGGIVVLYFLIALEVLIMISPFAGFFYAAFNPVLLLLDQWPATRWLSAFFLPHMILPPGLFLKAIRIGGSVFLLSGSVVFLVCAVQVYYRQVFRKGPALRGLYQWIRHPQYLALSVTGIGLAILWPRFLTIVLWTIMVGLYYLLALEEERRMLSAYGDQYRAYMQRTGMFFPRGVERIADRVPQGSGLLMRRAIGFVVFAALVLAGAFALRAYTVAELPLWSEGRLAAVAILPVDVAMLEHRMADVLELPEIKARIDTTDEAILAYVLPPNYVMQGMIADTGKQWRLYEHHQTLAMFADWILHPFRHLSGGHMMNHPGHGSVSLAHGAAGGMVRRVIFLRIDSRSRDQGRESLFGVEARRTPFFYADVDFHGLAVLDVHALASGTGWGRVPTPMF